MSELDLGLKVAARRMLWRMGYSTRIDVPLRAFGSYANTSRGSRTPIESYTDLDVLGVTLAPGASVETAIVDCKTGTSSAISRMFWIRGLSDFFSATSAYMAREREISAGARQLASKLRITALTGEEVIALELLHPTSLPIEEAPLSRLFDQAHVASVQQRWAEQDRRLKSLLEYREFDYWVYDQHLNLIQMVEHLRQVLRHLDARHPQHLAILFDCAWLYLLAVIRSIETIRGVHVSNIALGLKEYLLGGPERVREKENLAALLHELRSAGQLPDSVNVDALPAYFPNWVDLVTRVMRRSDSTVSSLQYLEYLTSAAMVGVKTTTTDGFGAAHSEIAAKIAENVVSFLVQGAELDGQFLIAARARLFGAESIATTASTDVPQQLDLGSDTESDPA